MNLLHVDSSILGEHSASRRLTRSIVDHWLKANPGTRVTRRDLAVGHLAHLSGATIAAGGQQQPGQSPETAADVALGAALLEEFLAADVIVVGAPMYNFGIPSQLKAWIDRLAVAGKTFHYTESGPRGLAGGKIVVIASSRGGIYSEGAAAALDHQEVYLKAVFGFFGIEDIRIIRAEGVAMGDASRERAFQDAEQAIASLAA